jgi:hypothetical protein
MKCDLADVLVSAGALALVAAGGWIYLPAGLAVLGLECIAGRVGLAVGP